MLILLCGSKRTGFANAQGKVPPDRPRLWRSASWWPTKRPLGGIAVTCQRSACKASHASATGSQGIAARSAVRLARVGLWVEKRRSDGLLRRPYIASIAISKQTTPSLHHEREDR
ncbi:hypothetical protein CTA1_7156 [Colletotrichum tanaceti]|uniref:Uncharacterized protein n=1 Tax=Colletotrichum tanaceti TaxID=1306861 RepID=A0A4U6XTQ7_9PEZI|nr:hypothetical protein CTA1_7156 [Colletotrichum tanaceti]